MKCIKFVFHYIKLTKRFAFQFNFQHDSTNTLTFYCDSDLGWKRKVKSISGGGWDAYLDLIFNENDGNKLLLHFLYRRLNI